MTLRCFQQSLCEVVDALLACKHCLEHNAQELATREVLEALRKEQQDDARMAEVNTDCVNLNSAPLYSPRRPAQRCW